MAMIYSLIAIGSYRPDGVTDKFGSIHCQASVHRPDSHDQIKELPASLHQFRYVRGSEKFGTVLHFLLQPVHIKPFTSRH